MRKYSEEAVSRLRGAVLAMGSDPKLWEDVTAGDHACWAAGVQLAAILARLTGYLNEDPSMREIAGVGKNGHVRAALIMGMNVVKRVRGQIRDDRREARKEGRKYPERLQAAYEEILAFGEKSLPALMGKVTREEVLGDEWTRDVEAIELVLGLHDLRKTFERTAGEEYHRAMVIMQAKNVLMGLEPEPVAEVGDVGDVIDVVAEVAEA